MNIRLASEADFDAVMQLINAAFVVERFFKAEDRVNAPMLQEYFRKGIFLVSQDEGGLSGCVFVERKGQRAYLGLLSVDPSRQKSGIGRRLSGLVGVQEKVKAGVTVGMPGPIRCRFG